MKVTTKKIIYMAFAVLFCFSLFLFTKKPGKTEIEDIHNNVIGNKKVGSVEHFDEENPWDDNKINPDHIVLYSNSNRWPKWSPFYKKYYGFANSKTGYISDDIYVDKLAFGEDGLAWDYKGHFIDENGNISISVEDFMNDYSYSDNPRKFFLKLFMRGYLPFEFDEAVNDPRNVSEKKFLRTFSDIYTDYHEKEIGDFDVCGLLIFPHDGYIYIDKTGKNVFNNSFYYATPFEKCGLAIVEPVLHKKAVINLSGEYVIEPTNEYENILILDGKIEAYKYRYEDECDIYDFDGNKLEQ